jgi:hypothetical protein
MKSRPNVAGDDLLPPSKSGLLASLDLFPPSKNAILALLPLAEETADNSKVVVVSKISHSKTLAEDVKNCQDYLLPPSKSSLLTSLLVALLPCKLGSKEGTKDVDKLLRGRDVDKLLARSPRHPYQGPNHGSRSTTTFKECTHRSATTGLAAL